MIEDGVPVSAKVELFQGVHDFNNDTFKLALYGNDADLTILGTSAYTTAGEVTGTGYGAGGVVLAGNSVSADGEVAVVDFDDITLTGATVTYRAGVIYNSTKSNRAVRIIDFGAPDGPETNPTIRFPTPGAQTATIRM